MCSEISTHTAVIRRKTVKSAKHTTSDTCAVKSRRYEFSDSSGHTVVINLKTVKHAMLTICDTCALK